MYRLYNVQKGGENKEIQKLTGFSRIYQAECFPDEVNKLFGKNTGDKKRYLKWLFAWLSVLDNDGKSALNLEQFEQLKGAINPYLYVIRHPHNQINERYIYIYADEDCTVFLTAY